ncbi:WAT1-related protein [Platanthera zijinensis]|uniref:WAT1-related protein n=1 Tax=Platanthera zijinensis TaxID=2320716 RepID=A0AAP0BR76_9ASPA
MGEKKPYVVIFFIQLIYTGLYLLSKAAFDRGMSTFTFIFYRQLAAAVLLVPPTIITERRNTCSVSFWLLAKIFMHALIGITFSLNIYNVGMKDTSATVASAVTTSVPVITFFLALLMRMETLSVKSLAGISKIIGLGICSAGVLTIAFYTGPQLSPLINYHPFGHKNNATSSSLHSKGEWIKGTFLMIIANSAWSFWMVLQGWLLKECPSKLLFTAIESAFSAIQSFLVAVAFERDISKWKLRVDLGLLAIAYSFTDLCGLILESADFVRAGLCIRWYCVRTRDGWWCGLGLVLYQVHVCSVWEVARLAQTAFFVRRVRQLSTLCALVAGLECADWSSVRRCVRTGAVSASVRTGGVSARSAGVANWREVTAAAGNADAGRSWRKKNAKAEFSLKRAIVVELFEHIIGYRSVAEIWTSLDELFNRKNVARLPFLENELPKNTQGDLPISTFFLKIKNLCVEISALDRDGPISKVKLKSHIICSLRKEYVAFVTSVQGWVTQPSLLELENLLAS